MSNNRMTRRTMLPALTAGAAAAMTGGLATPALAAVVPPVPRRTFSSASGPFSIGRGQTVRFQFFLPADERTAREPSTFRLSIRTLDGKELATSDFQLLPNTGKEMALHVTDDGVIQFGGVVIGTVPQGLVVIAIIAILIGLLLPAVQKVRSTANSFGPDVAGELRVNFVLPFVEDTL